MDDNVWRILTTLCFVGVITLVATRTKGRSTSARVGLSLVAAFAVGGTIGAARPPLRIQLSGFTAVRRPS